MLRSPKIPAWGDPDDTLASAMKLFMLFGCPFAHRAFIVLKEKRLQFELIYFDRGNRPPELEAAGPRAKSPTLFDEGGVIFDSAVVLEYLEDRYPEPALLPANPLARAQVRMFQTRVAEELMPKQGALIGAALLQSSRDEAKVAEASRAFLEALPPWERALEGRTHPVGEAFSLADITLYTPFPSLRRFANLEVPKEYPNLRAFIERMDARPSTRVPEAGR